MSQSTSSQSLGIGVQIQVYLYYVFLFLGGYVCIPLSLVTMYITKANVRRYPTFINCLISWFFYTLPTMFLYVLIRRHTLLNFLVYQQTLCWATFKSIPSIPFMSCSSSLVLRDFRRVSSSEASYCASQCICHSTF